MFFFSFWDGWVGLRLIYDVIFFRKLEVCLIHVVNVIISWFSFVEDIVLFRIQSLFGFFEDLDLNLGYFLMG